VAQGASIVNESGQIMTDINHSVHRVTDVIAEISAASTEQSMGISQVNAAVAQMDDVTQQNAALVEQAAAAAESLEDQAHQLANLVRQFKLNHEDQKVAALPAPKRAKHALPAPASSTSGALKTSHEAKKVSVAASKQASSEDSWEEF
jgi:methyl-accepting chemotaxis protein